MERLSPSDIEILEKRIASGKQAQLILLGLTAAAAISFIAGNLFDWDSGTMLFIVVFGAGLGLATVIQFFLQRKLVRDLVNGVAMATEGVIVKKEMKKSYNSYFVAYPKESLTELEQYIREKETGSGKDYGIRDWNLSEAARSSFLLILDNMVSFSVDIRTYIDLEIGDRVIIIHTPLSGTFLRALKV